MILRSIIQSKYRAMAQATCELLWVQCLLCEIGFSDSLPMTLWCDNQVAIHIASNPVLRG